MQDVNCSPNRGHIQKYGTLNIVNHTMRIRGKMFKLIAEVKNAGCGYIKRKD